MIRGFNHVGISVADLDRSIRFYREAFGLEVIERCAFSGELYQKILALSGARGRVALLRNGNLQLELFEFAAPQGVRRPEERSVAELGISHFCVDTSDIESEYVRLQGCGASFHCPPLDFDGRAKATYGRDPDGNVFELWERGPRSDEYQPGHPGV